jgi:hypothetical protein
MISYSFLNFNFDYHFDFININFFIIFIVIHNWCLNYNLFFHLMPIKIIFQDLLNEFIISII